MRPTVYFASILVDDLGKYSFSSHVSTSCHLFYWIEAYQFEVYWHNRMK